MIGTQIIVAYHYNEIDALQQCLSKSGFLPLQPLYGTREIPKIQPTVRLRATCAPNELRSGKLEENMISHGAQTILAIGISSALCLTAWEWAQRRLARLSHQERE